MPLTEAPYSDNIARPYFSGLLPDEHARKRLAAALGVSAENPFKLLEIIGGECAGALLYRQNTPDLAPIYDVVNTAVYPRLSKNLAMKIGGRGYPDTIQLTHWHALVPETKTAQRLLASTLRQMAETIAPTADVLLEDMQAEGTYHPILKTAGQIIKRRAQHIFRITDDLKP